MARRAEKKQGATPMQQKPQRQLRLPLWLVQVTLVLAVGYGSFWGLQQISWGWPAENIEIEGEFRYWSPQQLGQELMWIKQLNFFSLNVRDVKEQLEALPLIQSAQVKKIWPESLVITFKEDIPVARWNGEELLNPHAQKLSLPGKFDATGLPLLTGPENKEQQVMRQFQRLQQKLLVVGESVVSLSMNPVGSWQLSLANGWQVYLGRQQQEIRIKRLVELLKMLPQEKVAVVDLRYGKGAAIEWLAV